MTPAELIPARIQTIVLEAARRDPEWRARLIASQATERAEEIKNDQDGGSE
jgi:hypothetical protein